MISRASSLPTVPPLAAALLVALLALCAAPAAAVTIHFNLVDPPGSGFKDPTPVEPVGGNPGLTLGEQRLNAFRFAADLWGKTLAGDVDLVVQIAFVAMPCTPDSASLGAAGTIQIFADFPGAPRSHTWYTAALANQLSGNDLAPGPPDPGFRQPPFADDIAAFFNASIDSNPECLTGSDWYYGLDNRPPPGDIDAIVVFLHELGHGLGFSNMINEATGADFQDMSDIFSIHTLDETTGLHWDEMTDAERAMSAINAGHVVWDGPAVNAAVADELDLRTVVELDGPEGAAGAYPAQPATFGPQLGTEQAVSGKVVLADDATGTPTDACEALAQPEAVAGHIVLADRGGCPSITKTVNAQAAGAAGLIVAEIQPGFLPLIGEDPAITIPTVSVTQVDGAALRARVPGIVAHLRRDPTRLAGASDTGRMRLYTTNPLQPGSSIVHWDVLAQPNLLMEPFVSMGLKAEPDLTLAQMTDIGWTLLDGDGDGVPDIEDACPSSDTSATVGIDGGAAEIENTLLETGCTLADLLPRLCARPSPPESSPEG